MVGRSLVLAQQFKAKEVLRHEWSGMVDGANLFAKIAIELQVLFLRDPENFHACLRVDRDVEEAFLDIILDGTDKAFAQFLIECESYDQARSIIDRQFSENDLRFLDWAKTCDERLRDLNELSEKCFYLRNDLDPILATILFFNGAAINANA